MSNDASANAAMQQAAQQAYADRILWNGAPIGSNQDASIMQMRWESPEFIASLWQLLAGRTPKVIDGQVWLVKENPDIEPLMNDIGANRLIQFIRGGFVNPVISLSNITDEDARTIYSFSMKRIRTALVLNQVEWGVKGLADLKVIDAALDSLIFSQLMRAVGGHESKQSRTQTQEIKQESMSTNRTQGGFSLNPLNAFKK